MDDNKTVFKDRKRIPVSDNTPGDNNFILMSREEAAKALGIKANTLAVWAMKNIGPAPTKIGRYSRYRLDVIEAYISENTMPRSGKGGGYGK